MPQNLTNKPKFDFRIETAEVRKEKQGFLFYVLPPLLVLGVFVYCDMKSPEKAAVSASPVVQKVHYSTTAQPVSDEELGEEEEGEEEETGEGEAADE